MQRAARSSRVGLCSDRASALRRGRGSWRSASARHGGRTALALSLDHAECIGRMRARGSTCPRSGTAAAGAGRAVRPARGGYTVPHPARHGVCGLSQVAVRSLEELESEDRACLPYTSHRARVGLACNECQEPLGASCYAGRRLAGRRTIIDHGHLLGGGVAGDLRREVDACFFLLRRSA